MNQPSNAIPQGLNIFEAILARRTVRAYAPDVVGKHTIHTLLEAAMRAPTAMQEPAFGIVCTPNHKEIALLRKQVYFSSRGIQ